MRGLIFGIAGLLLLASPAICQVDTLMLVEIGSIEAPAEITELYIEDLDGDSLKEIILTTATNIHIYNGITYEEIWASPELDHPRDLLFEDINLDGFVDFSVKDTTNIHLLDPHNDTVIWTSPAIDSTYMCYTIGDRNDDDWMDALIVNQVPTGTTYGYDTVWVSIYDGPSMDLSEWITAEFPRYDSGGGYTRWGVNEWADAIVLNNEDESTGQSFIYVFSDYYRYGYDITFMWTKSSGKLRVYDASDLTASYLQFVGNLGYFKKIKEGNYTYLYSYNSEIEESLFRHSRSRFVTMCLSDTALSQVMWSVIFDDGEFPPQFGTSIIDEISTSIEGEEFCYSVVGWWGDEDHQLFLKSLDGNELWNNNDLHIISSIISGLNLALYDNLRLLIIGSQSDFLLLNGESGEIVAVISGQGALISRVADIDADGNDEILSIDDADLNIYGLQRTAIEDESFLPDRPFLLSNYPNPFNSSTIIEYNLPQAGHVNIEIYDLLGRRVEILVDKEQEAGTYQVVWDAGDRSSGVYFYKITSGEFAETKRMVLLK